jgi:hypothetical protein
MGNAAAVLGVGGLRLVEVHGKDVGGVAAYLPQLCSLRAAYSKCSTDQPVMREMPEQVGSLLALRFVLNCNGAYGCSRWPGAYFRNGTRPIQESSKQAEASDGPSPFTSVASGRRERRPSRARMDLWRGLMIVRK